MSRSAARFLCYTAACAVALAGPLGAQAPVPAPKAASSGTAPQAALSQDQLDSLVAPIALYPDKILVQILMASTYPLDVVEASRFVKANRDKLKGDAMLKAAQEKNWDPSVQSLTAYGQVLEMMNDKLEWMQQLGDAVLADQKAVMTTAQRLREKAQAAGNLKSNEQQKVVVQQDKTIIIEPAQPQTVYVPSYNPAVVYGSWWAPAYPPYYYPPPPYYYPGYAYGAAAVGFGVGLAVGAAWGWAGANWGGGDINIDVNNNFTRNNAEFNNRSREGGNKFNHNAAQRKGVAYRDQGTRDKFGATDRNAASQRSEFRGHEGAGNRAGTSDRTGAGGDRGGGAGGLDRGSGPSAGVSDRAGASNRASPGGGDRGGAGGGNFGSAGGGGGSFDRGGGGSSSFGGGGGNYGGAGSFNSGANRAQTQSYSNRGATSRSSMSSGGGARAGGGGGSRGGGGGGRGGGGRR